jgi:hypothetical protein
MVSVKRPLSYSRAIFKTRTALQLRSLLKLLTERFLRRIKFPQSPLHAPCPQWKEFRRSERHNYHKLLAFRKLGDGKLSVISADTSGTELARIELLFNQADLSSHKSVWIN